VSYGLTFRRVWIVAVVVALLPVAPRPLQATGNLDVATFFTAGKWRPYLAAGQTLVPVPTTEGALDAPMMQAAATLEFDVPAEFLAGPDTTGLATAAVRLSPTAQLLRSVAASGVEGDIDGKMRSDALADLRAWHASILVLVSGGKAEVQVWDTVTYLLGVTPRWVDGVWVWDVRALLARGSTS
jgi:hypothetical protein